MPNLPATSSTDEATVRLIELATRLTEAEMGGARNVPNWLRTFRRNYRHLAVTYGLKFRHADLTDAEAATDSDLDSKAAGKAA